MKQNNKEVIVEMYKEGRKVEEIKETTGHCKKYIYKCLKEANVLLKNNFSATMTLRKQTDEKLKEAVTTDDIERFRKNTKVGDRLYIKTLKGNLGDSTKQSVEGATKQVVVVSTNNKRHCLVEHETGVRESVLWVVLVMAKRRGKLAIL